MKKVTSVTFWNDAVGKRLSITYAGAYGCSLA